MVNKRSINFIPSRCSIHSYDYVFISVLMKVEKSLCVGGTKMPLTKRLSGLRFTVGHFVFGLRFTSDDQLDLGSVGAIGICHTAAISRLILFHHLPYFEHRHNSLVHHLGTTTTG